MELAYKKKQATQKNLITLKNSYIESIYCGLIEKKTIKEIHKELYDNTMRWKVRGLPIDNVMYNNALKLTRKLKKKVPNEILSIPLLAGGVFEILEHSQADKFMSQNIYKSASKTESQYKEKALTNAIKTNRQLKIPKVFYLASKHNDSAEDHKDFQGKIYIDEKWRSIITDKELKKKINIYISKHNVKTFQWVIGKPVWFITRPNCRHYFKTLNTEDVLNISLQRLIDDNNMSREIGQRQYLQTLKHPTNKKWYKEVRNAELILQKYEWRLDLHKMLYNQYPSEVLFNAIKKDKLLIKKWKDYLQSVK